jgi:hypothetical protein
MKQVEVLLLTILKLLTKVLVFLKGGGGKADAVRVTIADEDLTALTCNSTPMLPASFDASGSLRTSMKNITGYYTQLRGLNSDFDTAVTGGGFIGFTSALKAATLKATTTGDIATMKTFKVHPYITGKSSLFEFTVAKFVNQDGATKRVGAWHSNAVSPYQSNFDGFYLESYSTAEAIGYRAVIANNGVLVNVERESWDDPLDGTGPSGTTVDFNKILMFRVDFLGIGGSRIVFSIFSDGLITPFLIYKNANYSDTLLFTKPNLPIRAELIANNAILGQTIFHFICGVAAVEDSQDLPGNSRTVRTGITASTDLALPAEGVAYLGLAMRIGSTYDDVAHLLTSIGVLSASNDSIAWEIVINPIIAGDALSWGLADDLLAVEYAIGNSTNTTTGGTRILGDIIRADRDDASRSNKIKRIGKGLNGVSQIIAIVLTPSGTNGAATVVLNYDQF